MNKHAFEQLNYANYFSSNSEIKIKMSAFNSIFLPFPNSFENFYPSFGHCNDMFTKCIFVECFVNFTAAFMLVFYIKYNIKMVRHLS